MKYWNNKGKYTTEIDAAWEKYVPASGDASSLVGQVVRAFGRINYEIFNNGCGNMIDDEGFDEGNLKLNKFYRGFFCDLNRVIGYALCLELENACIKKAGEQFEFDQISPIIDSVGDKVGEWVVNNS